MGLFIICDPAWENKGLRTQNMRAPLHIIIHILPFVYNIYMSSVNCRKFLTVFYTSCKSFIDNLYLGTKLWNIKVQNSGQNSCADKL